MTNVDPEAFAPELVVAFVAPTGLSFEEIALSVEQRLSYYRYDVERIRLSEFLEERRGLSEAGKQLEG